MTIAVRVAHKLNDPSFVCEPVEKGRGHFVIGKNLIPVAKAQIASDDNGNLFIQIAHQLKEELRSSLVYRNEAEFIEDEEIKLDKTSEETRERQFLLSHLQVIDQGCGFVKPDPFALATGGYRQANP